MKRFPALLAATLITAPAMVMAQTSHFADVSLSVHHDDNISRAFLGSDRFSDTSLQLGLTAGQLYLLPTGQTVSLFGMLDTSRFDALEGFNTLVFGGGASYNHRLGLGAYAPEISGSFTVSRINSEGRARDRDEFGLELGFSKRFSPAVTILGGVTHTWHQGYEDGNKTVSPYSPYNDIYDFEETGVFATLDYQFSNLSALSLSYEWRDGSTISSALAPNPALLAIATALTIDPALTPPAGRKYVAYSLQTDLHSLGLDWSIPVGRDTALGVGVSRQEIKADQGVSYSNDRISINLMHAF